MNRLATRRSRAAIVVLLAGASAANAQPGAPDPDPVPAPDPHPEPVPDPEPNPNSDRLAPDPPIVAPKIDPESEQVQNDLDDHEKRIREVERTRAEVTALKKEVDNLRWLTRFISVYIDVGAFVVGGDGTGIRSDFTHTNFPEYRNSISGQWVFMGDPFTTMINSLGEPADTGSSREVATDTINSGGNATFIVNTVGLNIGKELGHGISISGLAHFLPRPGNDILDVPFAYVTYRPSQQIDLILEAGKIESVLGLEYRTQDAPKRLTVTPSLICRYTCGRPLGVDARLVKDFGDGTFNAAAAITNGNNFEERFEPENSLKANKYPTFSGHLLWKTRFGDTQDPIGFEVGVSAAVGPQDVQPDNGVHQWHYGFDLRLSELGGWTLTAEFVHGKQQGSSTGSMDRNCDLAPCLTYKGAYVLAERRVSTRFTPYARIDWRDAQHRFGPIYAYEANSVRVTVGGQLAVTKRILAKAEYNFNREIGVPQFPHDVFTTSIVVATD